MDPPGIDGALEVCHRQTAIVVPERQLGLSGPPVTPTAEAFATRLAATAEVKASMKGTTNIIRGILEVNCNTVAMLRIFAHDIGNYSVGGQNIHSRKHVSDRPC